MKYDLKKDSVAILFILIIILLGYYEIFLGSNFLISSEPLIMMNFAHGNAISNGWRPDKHLGMSFFFGDPGAFHPWSIYALIEKMIPSRELVYNISVLLLMILTVITLYFFLKRVTQVSQTTLCMLAPIIIFGAIQHKLFFSRLWITLSIGTPLIMMLLYDYYKAPKIKHLFYAGALFWFVWFFGSTMSFLQVLIIGGIFTIVYYIYHKREHASSDNKDLLTDSVRRPEPALRLLYKFVVINFFGMIWTILIGAWIFYSLFIEHSAVKYIREISYMQSGLINIRDIFYFMLHLLEAGWVPENPMEGKLIGNYFLTVVNWNNCSIVFPIIFLYFIFNRASNFWEFALKWMLIILLANEFLYDAFPAYGNLIQGILHLYPLKDFQPSYHVFEIALIGIFLSKIADGNMQIKLNWGIWLKKGIGYVLILFYLCLTIVSIFALFKHDAMTNMSAFIINRLSPPLYKDLLIMGVSYNILQIQNSIHWYSLVFYLSSAALILLFIKREWLIKYTSISTAIIACMLLINGILLFWTVYPLNKNGVEWKGKKELAPILSMIKPTDRFYYFYDPQRDNKTIKENNTVKEKIEYFKMTYLTESGKPHEPRANYKYPPALHFNSNSSYCPKDTADFIFKALHIDDKSRSIRDITGSGPLVSSGLLDMSAITYYYTTMKPTVVPDNLSLIFKTDQLYVYKNLNAWPYFYLADKTELLQDGTYPEHPVQGTAYLNKKDFFETLTDANPKSTITLKEFSYGKLNFDYDGKKEELLVIADAWHPFWKARAENIDLPVIKVNSIFKGIKLPKGRHDVVVYFDTSPYMLGIYISIVSIILFVVLLIIVMKYNPSIPYLSKAE